MNRLLLFIRTKNRIGWPDILVAVLIIGLLYAVLNLGKGMLVPFSPSNQPIIHLNPIYLPYYAGRSLLRMFIAFFLSLLFTLWYGRIAAYSRFGERLMVPVLDILQSVPVLGFLSVSIAALLTLFHGSLLGAEFASIFAIFTSQAWNMTFSFYQSLTTIPTELREAAQINRLRPWAHFTTLEVPFSMIGLVWNSMMSFGGSWFFLAASESITVLHYNIQLPGIGSYLAEAMKVGDVTAIAYGIVTMIMVIVAVDQFFWRPVVAWSQKFKMDQTDSGDPPQSWFLQILRRSEWVQGIIRKGMQPIGNLLSKIPYSDQRRNKSVGYPRIARVWRIITWIILGCVVLLAAKYTLDAAHVVAGLGLFEMVYVVKLGFFTLLRVMASTFLGALWTVPVGVAIGLNSRLSRIAQPLVQIAASFPSNMVFPLVTMLYIQDHINFQVGSIPLMMLGTQWYILFSVIAGAMSIPSGLLEASAILRLHRVAWWKTLILPGIFPYLVTGLITASGGAWNASIVAEIVTWKGSTLMASGLGAFIANATADGNWAQIIWGIAVMAIFVVLVNRLLWRSLHRLAETKYHLD